MIDRRTFIGGLLSLPFLNFKSVSLEQSIDKALDNVTKETPLVYSRPVGIDHDRICIPYCLLTDDNIRYISIHLDMPIDFIESIKNTCASDSYCSNEFNINKYILFISDENAWSAKYMLDEFDINPALKFPQWMTWRPKKPIEVY